MMLKFDDERLLETAKAVQAVNPFARNYTIEGLIDHMKATAHRNFADGSDGYVSTLGFVLTLWTAEDGTRHIFSSVASYSVNEFAQKVAVKCDCDWS